MYQEHQASRKCRSAMRRQVAQAIMRGRQPCSFVPPCVAPRIDDALRQSQVISEENRPNQIDDTAQVPVVAPEPQEATYSLGQVKELLAMERERLSRQ